MLGDVTGPLGDHGSAVVQKFAPPCRRLHGAAHCAGPSGPLNGGGNFPPPSPRRSDYGRSADAEARRPGGSEVKAKGCTVPANFRDRQPAPVTQRTRAPSGHLVRVFIVPSPLRSVRACR